MSNDDIYPFDFSGGIVDTRKVRDDSHTLTALLVE